MLHRDIMITVHFLLTLLYNSCLLAQGLLVDGEAWDISGPCLVPTQRQPQNVMEVRALGAKL